jgi:phenylacetate-CoA ligase
VAKERSPWHAARLAHIDARNVTLSDLPSIPPMTKSDMMANLDGIFTDGRLTQRLVEDHLASLDDDRYLLDEFHVVASGGSSGTRGVFVYDWDGWLQCRLSIMRFSVRHQQRHFAPGAPAVVGWVSASKATHMTFAMGRTFGGGAGGGAVSIPATLPLIEIVARLNELQPDILAGYPTMLFPLAREAMAGRLRISPRLVRPGSEPLLPEMRAALHDAWGSPVINVYGTSEGASASSCGEAAGMHLNDDVVIFEPVDANGAPVPPGRRAAKLLITNLYNYAQPLIRYELTDETEFIDGPCPCGAAMQRVADIEGRTDDVFVYDGGIVIHPLTFRSELGRQPAILEYQVKQQPGGAAIAIRAAGPIDTESLRQKVASALASAGLHDAAVAVEVVDRFDRQETGKLKRFIPME